MMLWGFSYSCEFPWCPRGHDGWFWHRGVIRTGLCYEQRWSYDVRKSICSCRKHGLKCVSSCGTCTGKPCENSDVRSSDKCCFLAHFIPVNLFKR